MLVFLWGRTVIVDTGLGFPRVGVTIEAPDGGFGDTC